MNLEYRFVKRLHYGILVELALSGSKLQTLRGKPFTSGRCFITQKSIYGVKFNFHFAKNKSDTCRTNDTGPEVTGQKFFSWHYNVYIKFY
jgi:hypothetical protein